MSIVDGVFDAIFTGRLTKEFEYQLGIVKVQFKRKLRCRYFLSGGRNLFGDPYPMHLCGIVRFGLVCINGANSRKQEKYERR
jgi:hypothetical protein